MQRYNNRKWAFILNFYCTVASALPFHVCAHIKFNDEVIDILVYFFRRKVVTPFSGNLNYNREDKYNSI